MNQTLPNLTEANAKEIERFLNDGGTFGDTLCGFEVFEAGAESILVVTKNNVLITFWFEKGKWSLDSPLIP